MAYHVELADSNDLIDLAASPYKVMPGSQLGMPAFDLLFSSPWQRGYQPLVAYNVRNRTPKLVLTITGTNHDDVIDNYNRIAAMVRNANERSDDVVLRVQMTGATYTTVFDVVAAMLPDMQMFQFTTHLESASGVPTLLGVELDLHLRPYGRAEQLTAVTSSSITNAGGTAGGTKVYSQAADLTTVRNTPARLTITPANDVRALVYGRKSTGNPANFIPVLNLQESAHTGYTVTDIEASASLAIADVSVGGAESGGVSRISYTASSAVALAGTHRVTINDNLLDWYGRYLVGVRLDSMSGSLDTLQLQLRYGGTGADIANPAVDLSTLTLTDSIVWLGTMAVPHRAGPAEVAITEFNFELWGAFQHGSNRTIDANSVVLVPIDEAFGYLTLSANSSAGDGVVVDGLPMVPPPPYVVDSTGVLQPELVTPGTSGVPGGGYTQPTIEPDAAAWFVLLFEQAPLATYQAGHNLADTFTVKLEAHAHYPQLRPSA
jgi:hypothetical protein